MITDESHSNRKNDCQCIACDKMRLQRTYYREHPMVWLLLLLCLGLILILPVLEGVPSRLWAYEGQKVTITGTVQESREGQYYLWLRLNDTRETLYVSLPWDREQADGKPVWYPAGTKLEIAGLLEKPQMRRNPGGFDEARWMRSEGAAMKLAAEEILILQQPQGLWQLAWKVQRWVKQTASQYLSQSQQGFTLALLFGEKQQLDASFYRLTQRIGIAHMFAVSGLHVGILGTWLLFFLRMAGLQRKWVSFVVLAAVLCFYCMLVGFPPSAVRAVMMMLLAKLAMQLLRPPAPVDFLAVSAIFLLLNQPFLLYTAGFQLSFGVTASLLLFVELLQKKLRWIPHRKLQQAVAVTMAAYLGSVPLTAWHFYTISLLAPFYNVLLIGFVAILVPLLLTAFLGTALLPTAGTVFFWPAGFLLQGLQKITVQLSNWISSGHWYIGRPSWFAVICYVIFLVCFWNWLRQSEVRQENDQGNSKSEKQNGESVLEHGLHKKQYRVRYCYGAVIALTLSVFFCIPTAPAYDMLTYLDAGQGSCAILRTKAGETFIFDGGASQTELASCLAWYGVNQVDAVILSHGDWDHIAGLKQVLEQVPVRYFCAETNQIERAELNSLLELAKEQGVQIKAVSEKARFQLEHGEIVLEAVGDGNSGSNSRELTAFVQINGTNIAFPGDLAEEEVRAFVNMQKTITIWTVPHHGSRFSSSEQLYGLLQLKGVQMAVISAGVGNRYGHPHQEVLQQLRQHEINVQRTDLQGAILLHLEGKKSQFLRPFL